MKKYFDMKLCQMVASSRNIDVVLLLSNLPQNNNQLAITHHHDWICNWPWSISSCFFLQVPNALGTSPPIAVSSNHQAFQKSTPTTWTVLLWYLPRGCQKLSWSSRALSWNPTQHLQTVCSAVTTGWKSGMAFLEVSFSLHSPREEMYLDCTVALSFMTNETF